MWDGGQVRPAFSRGETCIELMCLLSRSLKGLVGHQACDCSLIISSLFPILLRHERDKYIDIYDTIPNHSVRAFYIASRSVCP